MADFYTGNVGRSGSWRERERERGNRVDMVERLENRVNGKLIRSEK